MRSADFNKLRVPGQKFSGLLSAPNPDISEFNSEKYMVWRGT
ncbi:Uncharacterized protein dnm_051920 [Desulfonema magnum]|uniref:Uncharacterized protein n=1 Tax=Desulfonema magnum TaxID=45655 RepID=A0A975GQN7_9BACT|nr:Uncharacterized protein dnm_051920 [Desulfonema magnum]